MRRVSTVKDLRALARDLGYVDLYHGGSDLDYMLEDNPGLMETMVDWIEENLGDPNESECENCGESVTELDENDRCEDCRSDEESEKEGVE